MFLLFHPLLKESHILLMFYDILTLEETIFAVVTVDLSMGGLATNFILIVFLFH